MQPAISSTKQIGGFNFFNSVNGDFTIGGELIANGNAILFPPNKGISGDFLRTDGAGLLSWSQPQLSTLTDVLLNVPTNGNVLQYNGTKWANTTLAQPQLSTLSDVLLSSSANGNVLQYNGTKWVNATLAQPQLSTLSDVLLTSSTNGNVLQYNGTKWVNATLTSPQLSTLSDVLLSTLANKDVLQYNGSKWVNTVINSSSVGLGTITSDNSTTTTISGTSLSTSATLVTTGGTIKFNAASLSNVINIIDDLNEALRIETSSKKFMQFSTSLTNPTVIVNCAFRLLNGLQYGTNISAATGAITLDQTSVLWEFSNVSGATVTLPLSTSCPGQFYIIAKANVGTAVTVSTKNPEEFVNGTTTITLANQGNFTKVLSNGNGIWYIL